MYEPTSPRKFFVYGTFLKGFRNYIKAIEGHAVSISPAKTKGTLYHVEKLNCPAVKDGDGWVYGEIVELKDFAARLDLMDEIEGYYGPNNPDNLYERVVVTAENLETGESEEVYLYYYLPENLGTDENPCVPLPDGDWRAYMQSRG